MAINGGNIQYGISFKVDTSEINKAFSNLSFQVSKFQQNQNLKTDLSGLLPIDKVNEFRVALDRAYNPKLDTYNIKTFANEIRKSSISAKELKTAFSQSGHAGTRAYEAVSMQILKTEKEIIKTNKFLDEMATSFSNTIKWGISSSVFNKVTSSISEAYNYTKRLDKSLNDIRIVTGKSADEMERFAKVANNAAYKLGANTKEYTDAALIYYQQGDTNAEAQAKAETTLKAANVTGQDAGAVSEQLTAVWNGFNVTAGETEAVVDKLAAVAATTASDLEELATGMSKVASAANTMGVDVDQLSAQMSTIISVTRQAPESVGTALKTIFARMGDLQVDGVDEFGVTLGEVSSKMQTMGINVVDEAGNLRDMGMVIEEVAGKWDTWTESQKTAAAVAMAGKRQYNNLFALFENWGMYEDALKTSKDALGTLEEQNNIYLDSVDGRLTQLQTKWEELYSGIFKVDEIKPVISLMESLVEVFTRFTKATGGGATSLLAFGSVLTGVFSQQLGKIAANRIQKKAAQTENETSFESKSDFYKVGVDKENSESYRTGLKNVQQLDAISPYLAEDKRKERKEKIFQQYELKAESEAIRYEATSDIDEQLEKGKEKQKKLEEQTQHYDDYSKFDKAQQARVDDLNILKEQNIELQKKKELTESFFDNPTEAKDIMFNYVNNLNAEAGYDKVGEGLKYDVDTEELNTSNVENDIKALKKLKQEKTKIQNIDKKIEKIKQKATIEKRELSKEEETLIKKLKNEQNQLKVNLTTQEQEEKTIEEINEDLKKKEKLIKDAKNAQETMNKAIESESKSQDADKLQGEIDAESELDDDMLKRVSMVEVLTNGVSALTMALAGLNSVYQIWADTDASPWEKIGNTILTLGMQLPMIITQFNAMKTAALGLNGVEMMNLAIQKEKLKEKLKEMGITTSQITLENALIIAKGIGLSLDEAETDEDKKQLALEQIQSIMEKTKYTFSLKILATKAKEYAISLKETIAEIATAMAEKRYADATSAAATIGIGVAIAGAAIAGTVSAGNAEEEKQKQEDNTKKIEKENEKQEELRSQDEAFNKMKELNEEYKNGTISKSELRSQTMDLVNEYKLEGDAINSLIAGYGDYEEAVKNAKLQQLEELDASIKREKSAASDNLTQDSFVSEGKGYTFGGKYGVDVETGFVSKESQEYLRELKRQLDKTGLKYTGDIVSGDELEFDSTDENFSKYIEAIRATKDNVSSSVLSSEAVDIMQGQVDKFGDAVDAFDEAVNKEAENTGKKDALEKVTAGMTSEEYAKVLADYEANHSKEEYEAFKAAGAEINSEAAYIVDATAAMVDSIKEEGFSEKTQKAKNDGSYDKAKSQRNDEIINKIGKDINISQEKRIASRGYDKNGEIIREQKTDEQILNDIIKNKNAEDANGEEISYNGFDLKALHTMSKEEFDKYWINSKDEWDAEWKERTKSDTFKSKNFEIELSKLEDEDKKKILESEKYNEYYDDYALIGENTNRGYKETTSDGRREQKTVEEYATERAFQRIIYEAEIKVNEKTIESITSITDSLEKGTELTKEQEEELIKLEDQYSELGNIQDRSSDLYINKLNAIKDKLEENTIAARDASLSAGFEVAIADTDQLAKKLEDLTDADYNIKVAIEADMQSDFDEAVKQIEKMDDVSSKIGENFIVGAEDVEELATAFPGILTDVEYLSDGTVQLSEQATNAAINMAKEKAKADTETALEEIRNNKTLIEQKIAFADKMIQIAKSAANGEIKIDEAQAQAKELFEQTKIDFNTQTTNQEMKNTTASAENTAQATQDLADNYTGAYEAASIAAQKFMKNAAQANKVASGDMSLDSVEWDEDFKKIFEAKQSTAPDDLVSDKLTDSEEYSKLTKTEQWKETMQSWEAQREMWNDLLAEAEGKESELIARQNTLDYKFRNVKNGKGADGGDKSGSDPSQEDYIDDEIDKFHDLEKAIQRTEDALDRLATAEERAFGQDLIDNLDAQLENLAGQTALQEKKKDLAIQEAAALQTTLISQGVSFDEEGAITNYQSIIAEKINATNKIIEAYNGMSANEQEANEETVNKAKEDLEKFQEEIEKYIYDTVPEIQSRIDEIIDEKVEINVKKLNMEIDLRMKIVDSKDTFRTFKTQVLDRLEEGMLGYASSTLTGIQGMFEPTLNAINADVKNLALVEEEIKKMQNGETSNVFGNNMQVALEEIENIQSRLMDNMTSYYDLQQEANETYNESLDKLQEMLDLQQELYSNLNDIYEHGKELSALLYGEDDWTNRLAFDTEQFNVLKSALTDSKKALEESKVRLDELEEGTVEWCEEQERYNTLLKQTNDLEAQALEKAKEVRNDGIEKTLQDMEKSLFGGFSFEDAKENWEKLKKQSDKYFDSIEREYQTDTLERSFNKAISQNNLSLKAQKQLNQLKDEELKKLKEKENLSQYDVDRAQKLLDIEMARIALEEAQNNKTTLKLKRDAQGNYSYQYVANQDDIAEKEQNLANAENDLYQMDQEEYRAQMDEQFTIFEEFMNKVKESQDLGLAETEEFYRLLNEGYNNLMTNMTNVNLDMNTARTNLETAFFNNMTEEKVPQWAGDMEQMTLDHDILVSKIDEGTTEIEGYWSDAQEKMNVVSGLVNKDYGNIIGSTKTAASTTKDLSNKVNDLTEEYKEDVAQAKLVKNAIDEITKSQQAQITKVGEAITKNQEFYTSIQADAAEAASKITKSFETMAVDVKSYLDQASSYAAQAIAEAEKAAQAAKDAAAAVGVKATGNTSAKVNVWNGNGSKAEIGTGSIVFAVGGTNVYQDASAKKVEANVEETNTNIKVLEVTQDGTMAKVELESGEVGYIPTKNLWVKKSRVNSEGKAFDTGGYTGDWNSSEGRMAWLHEKELVLNKTDTKNMLKAIELTRSMDDIINSLESSVVNRINRLTQQLNEMVDCINIKAKLKDGEQKFKQNVEIHAEFPNVKGVDEIEQAFDNLNNRATQLSNYQRF